MQREMQCNVCRWNTWSMLSTACLSLGVSRGGSLVKSESKLLASFGDFYNNPDVQFLAKFSWRNVNKFKEKRKKERKKGDRDLLTMRGLKGGVISRRSSFAQSMGAKNGWRRISSAPLVPQPRRWCVGLVMNCVRTPTVIEHD